MAAITAQTANFYAKRQTAFLTPATLAGSDYIRTTSCGIEHMPDNSEPSPERYPGQDLGESFRRRPTTSLSVGALLRGAPEGKDEPELGPLLEEAFGSAAVEVTAEANLKGASVDGRVFGILPPAGGDGFLRPVAGVAAGEDLEFGSGTGFAFTGEKVYKCRAYNLGDEIRGLTARYQPESTGTADGIGPGTKGPPPQLVDGWVINETNFEMDGTGEVALTFSGPARNCKEGTGVDSLSAGANIADADLDDLPAPQQGMQTKVWFKKWTSDANLIHQGTWAELPFAFRRMSVGMGTPRTMRNDESGDRYSRGAYISGRRDVTVSLETYAEEGNLLWEAIRATQESEAPYFTFAVSAGTSEGARSLIYLPKVRLDLPSGDDGDDVIGWMFEGRAHSADINDGNSSIAVVLA